MQFLVGLVLIVAAIATFTGNSSEKPDDPVLQEASSPVTGPIKEGFKTAFSNLTDSVLEKPRALLEESLNLSPMSPYLEARNLTFAENVPQCDSLVNQAIGVMGLREQISALESQRQIESVISKGVQVGCFVQKTSLNLVTGRSQ